MTVLRKKIRSDFKDGFHIEFVMVKRRL